MINQLKKVVLGLSVGLMLFSCSKQEQVNQNPVDQLNQQILALTQKAQAEVSPQKDEMLLIDASWDTRTGTLSIQSSQVAALNFFPLLSPKSNKSIEDGESYNVDCCCDANGDLIWSVSCDGKFSCGSKIYDCLSAGGCAEICTATLIIIPPTATNNGLLTISTNNS